MNFIRNFTHRLALLVGICILLLAFSVATGKLGSFTLRIQHSTPDIELQYDPPPQPPAGAAPHRHAQSKHQGQH